MGHNFSEEIDYLKTCPVCLSIDPSIVRVQCDYIVLKCRCCGAFFEPCKDPMQHVRYEQSYYSSSSGGGYSNYREDMRKNRETFFKRLLRAQSITKVETIVDFGCALGETLRVAKEIGIKRAIGLEVSKYCVSQNQKDGLEVHFPEDFFAKNQSMADLVTLQDVLEHTIDPIKMLERSYQLLKKDGVVFICTPDIHSLSRYVLGKYWYHFKQGEHRIYFTRNSLHLALIRAGYCNVEIHSDTSFMAIERIIERFEKYNKPMFQFFRAIINSLGLGRIVIPIKIGNLAAWARKP